MTVTYQVTDIFGNTFICNHDPDFDVDDPSEMTYRIQIGSTHISPACVTIFIIQRGKEYTVSVQDFYGDKRCSEEENLPRGQQGTQSMLLCALQITKAFYLNAERFEFQDESRKKDDKGKSFYLSDKYMITRGKTWYESFLNIIPQTYDQSHVVYGFRNAVNSTMDMSYYEFMQQVFNNDKTMADKNEILKQVWYDCYKKRKWYEFIQMISEERKEYWTKNLKWFIKMLHVSSLSGVMWEGDLSKQDKRLVRGSMKKLDQVMKFGQTGGGEGIPGEFSFEETMY